MTTFAGCPSFTRGTIGSGTKRFAHALSRSVTTTIGVPRMTISPASTSFCVTTPDDRREDLRVGERLLEHGDLRVGGRDSRARGVDLFGARALLQTRDGFARRAHTLLAHCAARSRATSTLALASSRCFCEPALALSSASKRSRSSCAALRSASIAIDVGLGGIDLRLGLTDVLDARAGLEQPQLRDGGRPIGAAALDLQLGVARVELRDEVAAIEAIAFGHPQLEDPSTDFRRDVHLGRLDVTGDSQRVVGRRRRRMRRRRA